MTRLAQVASDLEDSYKNFKVQDLLQTNTDETMLGGYASQTAKPLRKFLFNKSEVVSFY